MCIIFSWYNSSANFHSIVSLKNVIHTYMCVWAGWLKPKRKKKRAKLHTIDDDFVCVCMCVLPFVCSNL